jgi:hypothetical protein
MPFATRRPAATPPATPNLFGRCSRPAPCGIGVAQDGCGATRPAVQVGVRRRAGRATSGQRPAARPRRCERS